MTRPAGWHHTPETKVKISESVQRARAESRAAGISVNRRCVRCKKLKNALRDFTWRKRKLVSGEVSYHPYPRCKQCQADAAAERRAQRTVDENRSRDKKWYRKRSKKRKAARRERAGVPEPGKNAVRVPAKEFLEWYDALGAKCVGSDVHPVAPY